MNGSVREKVERGKGRESQLRRRKGVQYTESTAVYDAVKVSARDLLVPDLQTYVLSKTNTAATLLAMILKSQQILVSGNAVPLVELLRLRKNDGSIVDSGVEALDMEKDERLRIELINGCTCINVWIPPNKTNITSPVKVLVPQTMTVGELKHLTLTSIDLDDEAYDFNVFVSDALQYGAILLSDGDVVSTETSTWQGEAKCFIEIRRRKNLAQAFSLSNLLLEEDNDEDRHGKKRDCHSIEDLLSAIPSHSSPTMRSTPDSLLQSFSRLEHHLDNLQKRRRNNSQHTDGGTVRQHKRSYTAHAKLNCLDSKIPIPTSLQKSQSMAVISPETPSTSAQCRPRRSVSSDPARRKRYTETGTARQQENTWERRKKYDSQIRKQTTGSDSAKNRNEDRHNVALSSNGPVDKDRSSAVAIDWSLHNNGGAGQSRREMARESRSRFKKFASPKVSDMDPAQSRRIWFKAHAKRSSSAERNDSSKASHEASHITVRQKQKRAVSIGTFGTESAGNIGDSFDGSYSQFQTSVPSPSPLPSPLVNQSRSLVSSVEESSTATTPRQRRSLPRVPAIWGDVEDRRKRLSMQALQKLQQTATSTSEFDSFGVSSFDNSLCHDEALPNCLLPEGVTEKKQPLFAVSPIAKESAWLDSDLNISKESEADVFKDEHSAEMEAILAQRPSGGENSHDTGYASPGADVATWSVHTQIAISQAENKKTQNKDETTVKKSEPVEKIANELKSSQALKRIITELKNASGSKKSNRNDKDKNVRRWKEQVEKVATTNTNTNQEKDDAILNHPSVHQLLQCCDVIPVKFCKNLSIKCVLLLCECEFSLATTVDSPSNGVFRSPSGVRSQIGGSGGAFVPIAPAKPSCSSLQIVTVEKIAEGIGDSVDIREGDCIVEVHRQIVIGESADRVMTIIHQSSGWINMVIARRRTCKMGNPYELSKEVEKLRVKYDTLKQDAERNHDVIADLRLDLKDREDHLEALQKNTVFAENKMAASDEQSKKQQRLATHWRQQWQQKVVEGDDLKAAVRAREEEIGRLRGLIGLQGDMVRRKGREEEEEEKGGLRRALGAMEQQGEVMRREGREEEEGREMMKNGREMVEVMRRKGREEEEGMDIRRHDKDRVQVTRKDKREDAEVLRRARKWEEEVDTGEDRISGQGTDKRYAAKQDTLEERSSIKGFRGRPKPEGSMKVNKGQPINESDNVVGMNEQYCDKAYQGTTGKDRSMYTKKHKEDQNIQRGDSVGFTETRDKAASKTIRTQFGNDSSVRKKDLLLNTKDSELSTNGHQETNREEWIHEQHTMKRNISQKEPLYRKLDRMTNVKRYVPKQESDSKPITSQNSDIILNGYEMQGQSTTVNVQHRKSTEGIKNSIRLHIQSSRNRTGVYVSNGFPDSTDALHSKNGAKLQPDNA